MTGDGRTRAEWNVTLMTDVIGPSYARMLTRAKGLLGFNALYQALWPPLDVPSPWTSVVDSMLQETPSPSLFHPPTHPPSYRPSTTHLPIDTPRILLFNCILYLPLKPPNSTYTLKLILYPLTQLYPLHLMYSDVMGKSCCM